MSRRSKTEVPEPLLFTVAAKANAAVAAPFAKIPMLHLLDKKVLQFYSYSLPKKSPGVILETSSSIINLVSSLSSVNE